MKEEKVYLTLQNGQVFEGKRFGARGDVIGELVFTTGMTGYIETLTDPSYYGQIVIQTFPLIGNYGMIPADAESRKPFLSAYIVREYCEAPSNFRCEGKLDDYLKAQGIVGVYGIDTRQLTRIVRETGVMNAVISTRPVNDVNEIKKYAIRNAVESVTCAEPAVYGEGNIRTVALWDRLRRGEYTHGGAVGFRCEGEHRARTRQARLQGDSRSRLLYRRANPCIESGRVDAHQRPGRPRRKRRYH